MPRRDGSGPLGLGPLTGRGLGSCKGNNMLNIGMGIGTGLGVGYHLYGKKHGWRIGRRNDRYTYSLEDEKNDLLKRLDIIESLIKNKKE